MSFPTLTHKVDFAHDPSSSSYTWTDLTSRVVGFSCTRGRAYEQAAVDASTASYQWTNNDGALDPTNTGSTYYPNVIPYRRVQTQATWSGTTYNVFTGLVERWPLGWDSQFGTVDSQCTDIFALLSNKILSVGYQQETLSDSPTAYYPFDEAEGTSAGNRVSGGTELTGAQSVAGGGDLTFGSKAITAGDTSATSLEMNTTLTSSSGDDLLGYYFTGPAIQALSTTYSFECWVKIDSNLLAAAARHTDSGAPNPIPVLCIADSNGNVVGGICLFDNSDGKFRLAFLQTSNSTPGVTVQWGSTIVDLNDKAAHHLVITNSVTNGGLFYVDGVSRGGFGTSIGSIGAGSIHVGGYKPDSWLYGLAPNFRGFIQHAAIYSTELTAARISAHYNIGAGGFAGDTADARISRILAYAGWTGPTALDACTTTMLGVGDLIGQSALAAIQNVAKAEGGVFFVAKDGTLTYKSRRARMATTTSSYTFGDGAGELPYTDLSFDFDPTYIYNDVQVQRNGAASVYVSDATSQGHYGTRTFSETLNIQSDSEAVDAANWILANYKDPHLRAASMTLDPPANTALWPAVLNMEIGTRVTVKRRPFGSSNTITGDFFVEQINHQPGERTWVTTLALSPVQTQALLWDDATAGKWDTDVWAW